MHLQSHVEAYLAGALSQLLSTPLYSQASCGEWPVWARLLIAVVSRHGDSSTPSPLTPALLVQLVERVYREVPGRESEEGGARAASLQLLCEIMRTAPLPALLTCPAWANTLSLVCEVSEGV